MSETDKVREIESVMKYITDDTLDIGCGGSKITPGAYGVDGRQMDGVNFVVETLYGLPNKIHRKFSVVYSSHCLEHLQDDYLALIEWASMIKDGGHLILYLPDGRCYDHNENLEHCRNYTYDSFMFFFKRCFCGEGKDYKGQNFQPVFELIESGGDFGDDKYSFYLVAKKL